MLVLFVVVVRVLSFSHGFSLGFLCMFAVRPSFSILWVAFFFWVTITSPTRQKREFRLLKYIFVVQFPLIVLIIYTLNYLYELNNFQKIYIYYHF